MNVLDHFVTSYQQTKELKEFILTLDQVDHEVKGFVFVLDKKLAGLEERILSLRGGETQFPHRCGLCERQYAEKDVRIVGELKVCPNCRSLSTSFLVASDFENKFKLSRGTVKRDCLSKEGQPAKLQSFIDCGLIIKSGIHNIVHERVYGMYYGSDTYKRRKRSKQNP
ncbi:MULTISPECIES: hypothetical protein [unclassified Paenibacillus]|uniref:hypothetical protein n=1 Tax=unclassified Paenibacillus TaxID=185978 RepID=UPI002783AEC5|nr:MULTISPECIES: hypothetical protein [unclassified Paenibacillus]MDQ0896249.1 hypothetical protein [Paenibacillus sp. V4I7]MDQ0913823.1 hypothetical protein [Paenibacillus sp. V4I5]